MNRFLFRLRSKIRNTLYHFKVANWNIIHDYNRSLHGTSFLPYLQLLFCSWRHGATFENYYELRFYEKNTQERKAYITASLRHELTRQVNNNASSLVLKDKGEFALLFKDLLGRKIFTYKDLMSSESMSSEPPKLVIKHRFGQAGKEVFFPESFATWLDLFEYVNSTYKDPSMYIFEEYIVQHHSLNKINPSCVNTLRVVSYYNEANDQVEVWGVYLRIGIDKNTDNLSTGGIVALVDSKGMVCRPAVKKDPLAPEFSRHPITNENIMGFEIPYYSDGIKMVSEAAKRIKKVKSIGWDVAITENGPCLIEGNDNWGMTLFQIPCGQGKRYLASAVCNMQMVYK